jgi:hypothetical protein
VSHLQDLPFAGWAQRRIARAVEAGHLSGDAAARLRARLAATPGPATPADREAVVGSLARTLGVTHAEAGRRLRSLEHLPPTTQLLCLRHMLEEWLESRLRALRAPER